VKRFLLTITGVGLLIGAVRAGRCLIRGRHEPVRAQYVPGAWRCDDCGIAAAHLGEMVPGSGWVSPQRRLYDRANGGTLTVSSHWDRTSRGPH